MCMPTDEERQKLGGLIASPAGTQIQRRHRFTACAMWTDCGSVESVEMWFVAEYEYREKPSP